MKRLLFFLLGLTTLMSCAGPVVHGEQTISFGQAWSHAFTLTSYKVTLVLAGVAAGLGVFWIYKDYSKRQTTTIVHIIVGFIALAILLAALLYAPAEMAANTTVEQAARGVYIR